MSIEKTDLSMIHEMFYTHSFKEIYIIIKNYACKDCIHEVKVHKTYTTSICTCICVYFLCGYVKEKEIESIYTILSIRNR